MTRIWIKYIIYSLIIFVQYIIGIYLVIQVILNMEHVGYELASGQNIERTGQSGISWRIGVWEIYVMICKLDAPVAGIAHPHSFFHLVHPTSFLAISFSELSPQAMLPHTALLIPGQLSRLKLHACSLHSSISKSGTSSLSLVSIRVNAFQEIQTRYSLFGLGLFFGSCYLSQPSQCDTNYCQNLLAGQKS